MVKATLAFETTEAMIEFFKSIPSQNETSPVAIDCETHPDTNIISQDEEDVKDSFEQISWIPVLSMNSILEQRGLSITNGKSGSSFVLGCRVKAKKMYEYVGANDFAYSLDVILDAYPDGGEDRWNGRLLMDVCVFVHTYRHEAVFNRKYLVNHLNKHVTSSKKRSPNDVVEMITDQPGEACLRLYNSGLSNQLPNILPPRKELSIC